MKKYLFLVFLVLLVVVSGCTKQDQSTQDPKQLLKDSIIKSTTTNYRVDYDFSFEIGAQDQSGEQNIKTIGMISQYKKDKKIKMVTSVSKVISSGQNATPLEEGSETSVYIIPEGIYQCNKIQQTVNCTKADSSQSDKIAALLDPAESLKAIDDAVASGQVSLKLKEEKTIANRKCNNFEILPLNRPDAKPTITCLDKETGVMLSNSIEINLGSVISKTNMVAKNVVLTVDDSEFVVPKTS